MNLKYKAKININTAETKLNNYNFNACKYKFLVIKSYACN